MLIPVPLKDAPPSSTFITSSIYPFIKWSSSSFVIVVSSLSVHANIGEEIIADSFSQFCSVHKTSGLLFIYSLFHVNMLKLCPQSSVQSM